MNLYQVALVSLPPQKFQLPPYGGGGGGGGGATIDYTGTKCTDLGQASVSWYAYNG
jgi:hypothetical protein